MYTNVFFPPFCFFSGRDPDSASSAVWEKTLPEFWPSAFWRAVCISALNLPKHLCVDFLYHSFSLVWNSPRTRPVIDVWQDKPHGEFPPRAILQEHFCLEQNFGSNAGSIIHLGLKTISPNWSLQQVSEAEPINLQHVRYQSRVLLENMKTVHDISINQQCSTGWDLLVSPWEAVVEGLSDSWRGFSS